MAMQTSDMGSFVSSVAPLFSSVVGAQISQCFLKLCFPIARALQVWVPPTFDSYPNIC